MPERSAQPTQRRQPQKSERPVNTTRRNILKFGAFGVGAFILGKIFGPGLNLFGQSFDGSIYDFKNFRVVENGQQLGFFDKLGNEILILENDPTSGS